MKTLIENSEHGHFNFSVKIVFNKHYQDHQKIASISLSYYFNGKYSGIYDLMKPSFAEGLSEQQIKNKAISKAFDRLYNARTKDFLGQSKPKFIMNV